MFIKKFIFDFMLENNSILAITSIIIGSFLGYLSTIFLYSFKQKQTVSLKLLDEYFKMREQVTEIISPLTLLDSQILFDSNKRNYYKEMLLKLAYKHYDLLPLPVIESLVLLYVCIGDNDGKIYKIENSRIISMTSPLEIKEFIKQSNIFENARYYATLALKSSNKNLKGTQAISLHAKNVLIKMNQYAKPKRLIKMTKILMKS